MLLPLLVLLVGSIVPKGAMAERQYSQLVFTKEKCVELGYGNDFDVCAVLEFCEGTGRRLEGVGAEADQGADVPQNHRRHLRQRRLDDWWGGDDTKMADESADFQEPAQVQQEPKDEQDKEEDPEDDVEVQGEEPPAPEEEPPAPKKESPPKTTGWSSSSSSSGPSPHSSYEKRDTDLDGSFARQHAAEQAEAAKLRGEQQHMIEAEEARHQQDGQYYGMNQQKKQQDYKNHLGQPGQGKLRSTPTPNKSSSTSTYHEVGESEFKEDVQEAKEETKEQEEENTGEHGTTIDETPDTSNVQEPEAPEGSEGTGQGAGQPVQQDAASQPEQHSAQPQHKPATETVVGDEGFNEAMYGWRLPGQTDCSYPGPIVRLQSGLKHGLIVQKSSTSKTPTNLHFHGLHMAGHGNGDDVHRKLEAPGEAIVYSIDMSTGHMGGTHWYHSHMVGKSLEQTKGGAFGMIVVEDNLDDLGTNDENVKAFLQNERVLIIDDTYQKAWTANGHIDDNDGDEYGYYDDEDDEDEDEGDEEKGNARDKTETYYFVQNEWYRLRVLMVGTNSHKAGASLEFGSACEAHAIAHDGILRREVPKSEAQSEFLLTSSSRLDVAIRCSSDASISVNNTPIAKVTVESNADGVAVSNGTPYEGGDKPWASKRMVYVHDMTDDTVENHWDIHVYETTINSQGWKKGKPLCSDGMDLQYGSIQEWTISGADTHPLHVHTYPMQVVGDCGDHHDTGEFYDSIVTSHRKLSAKHSEASRKGCKVRVHLVDMAGPTLAHCHIFLHAESGAMGYFNVVNGPVQPNEPRVYHCPDGADCDPAPETPPTCIDGAGFGDRA